MMSITHWSPLKKRFPQALRHAEGVIDLIENGKETIKNGKT